MKESFGEGTIGTSRGKAHCKSLFLARHLSLFFCTGKIEGSQDCTFLFQDGLANYKAHYSLSWFKPPPLGSNSPTSSDLISRRNSVYNGVSTVLEKFAK
jgi:hypothetical protein